jgi:hypothetical protein
MMQSDLMLNTAQKFEIDIHQLKGAYIDDNTHVLAISAGGTVKLYGTIEQIEDIGKACLDYVHAYNAAAMIETAKRVGA